MSNFEIELNSDGVRELLNSIGVQNILKSEADAIAKRYGKSARVYVAKGTGRAHANIVTNAKDNGENNELLRAMR